MFGFYSYLEHCLFSVLGWEWTPSYTHSKTSGYKIMPKNLF